MDDLMLWLLGWFSGVMLGAALMHLFYLVRRSGR